MLIMNTHARDDLGPSLRASLIERLRHLDAESARVTAVLKALDGRPAHDYRSDRVSRREILLEAIGADPGIGRAWSR
jgi:hypothetical protein